MGSTATIFIGVLASALGGGYFLYGKKQERPVAMIAGAALCLYPYLFDSALALLLVGIGLAALPFFFD
jgi:hypothetical protein